MAQLESSPTWSSCVSRLRMPSPCLLGLGMRQARWHSERTWDMRQSEMTAPAEWHQVSYSVENSAAPSLLLPASKSNRRRGSICTHALWRCAWECVLDLTVGLHNEPERGLP